MGESAFTFDDINDLHHDYGDDDDDHDDDDHDYQQYHAFFDQAIFTVHDSVLALNEDIEKLSA